MSKRNRTVIIHTGSWGDLYVATAALKEALDRHENLEGYVVGSKFWLQIIQPEVWPSLKGVLVSDNGFSADLYCFENNKFVLKSEKASLKSFFKTVAVSYNLRTESLRFAWAPWLAGVPERYGSTTAIFKWLYTQNAPWLGWDPVIHERDRMLQVVEGPSRIGVLAKKWRPIGLPKLKNFSKENAKKWVQADRYWLINPTSSVRGKAWPAEKFRELNQRLLPVLKEKNIALKIIGAPAESEWLREVAVDTAQIIQTPAIADLMDVVAGSNMLITNTSSIQFLASGFNVPSLTLMGRARPEIWGPLGPKQKIIRGTVDNSFDHDMFLQEKKAYESISVDFVFNKCLEELN